MYRKFDEIRVYKMVLEGRIKSFPRNFWKYADTRKIIRYLIEKELEWTDSELLEKLSIDTFKQFSLGSMLNRMYGNNTYKAIDHAYPNRFKPWEYSRTRRNTWKIIETPVDMTNYISSFVINSENLNSSYKIKIHNNYHINSLNSTQAIKWMIEEKLKWDDEDIKNNLSLNTFKEYGLYSMIVKKYNYNIYKAIDATYPNRFKPWELYKLNRLRWTKELFLEATKWMIEEKLKWNEEDIKNKLTIDIFKKYNIYGGLLKYYNGSTYYVVSELYPNIFKIWEFRRVPKHIWTKELFLEATKWMIEEKLKWNEEDIKNRLTIDIFKKYKLDEQIYRYYNYNIHVLLDELYPNKFKPWELKKCSKTLWTDRNNIVEAIKWMIEEKLQWDEEDIIELLTKNTFKENGLYTLICKVYKNNVYNAINEIYPGKFHRDDFDRRLKKNRINKG